MNRKRIVFVTLCGLALALTWAASAQQVDPSINEMALYGVNRVNGKLHRYDFSAQQLTEVGLVRESSGPVLTGIDAAAYIPGHTNLIAFHGLDHDNDGHDDQTHVLYVNLEDARAAKVGAELEHPGKVTGAVAGPNGNAEVSGLINLNPSNSNQNEFVLYTTNGLPITRDHLKGGAHVNDEGDLYEGGVHYVRVTPKGAGNQNGLIVNGQALSLSNGSTCTLVGSMEVRLFNDSVSVNNEAMGQWWLQVNSATVNVHVDGQMTAGGSTGASFWSVYALQEYHPNHNANAQPIQFAVDGDAVVPAESFAAKVTVLGAAISYGGQYNMAVTTKFKVGGAAHTPFGDFAQAATGNVNDDQNPRSYIFPSAFTAGTRIDVLGRAWKKKKSYYSGASNSHWKLHREIDGSNSESPYVKVLRHGDPVPDITGFMNQQSIEDFVKDFVDPTSNTVVLGQNEAIYLFELGVTDLNSAAADFQDLVVLVSLAKTTAELENPVNTALQHRLIKVNHMTGGYSQLMTLQRQYDGLATKDGVNFYATENQNLYRINIIDRTETLVGVSPLPQMFGLEFAGETLMGFGVANDQLVPVNVLTGQALGSPANLGAADLGAIVFTPVNNGPSIVAYD